MMGIRIYISTRTRSVNTIVVFQSLGRPCHVEPGPFLDSATCTVPTRPSSRRRKYPPGEHPRTCLGGASASPVYSGDGAAGYAKGRTPSVSNVQVRPWRTAPNLPALRPRGRVAHERLPSDGNGGWMGGVPQTKSEISRRHPAPNDDHGPVPSAAAPLPARSTWWRGSRTGCGRRRACR